MSSDTDRLSYENKRLRGSLQEQCSRAIELQHKLWRAEERTEKLEAQVAALRKAIESHQHYAKQRADRHLGNEWAQPTADDYELWEALEPE